MKEKKLSAGSLAGQDSSRPKMVTVKHPESNKPKPTAKKSKPIQADLDVGKEFIKCKEEGIKRLDLSKSSVSLAKVTTSGCLIIKLCYLGLGHSYSVISA